MRQRLTPYVGMYTMPSLGRCVNTGSVGIYHILREALRCPFY